VKVAYLIDTDWTIDYLNDKEPVASKIEELREEGIGLSIVSVAELYEGVYHSRDPEASERKLLGFLNGVAILGIDEEICRTFGEERGKLRKKGLLIGDLDLLIDSTSLHYEIPLSTNNRKHYERIEGLRIISA
jgi:tRNA(fMet)-specific endonuclease VapC